MHGTKVYGLLITSTIGVGLFLYFIVPFVSAERYMVKMSSIIAPPQVKAVEKPLVPAVVITHMPTPESVKAIYMTSWVAGTPSLRNKIISLIDRSEVNAVVIDIKDYTGKVSFPVTDPVLVSIGSGEKRISDIDALIAALHAKNVYVIGRIAVFQDPYFVKIHPELAVKKSSNKESLWGDKKGIHWLDAGSEVVWDYILSIGKESYAHGFDELNFDYIRFPSDGNMKDIYYPISDGKVKSEVLNNFFTYLDTKFHTAHIPISVDIFGMTTTNHDDLGIGQVLENALAHFDYVAPMVYPSHYPAGWNNFKNPAANPYDVIHYALTGAVTRAELMPTDAKKIRPWLQDFNLGATYTAEMVQKEIQATYDVGLTSWMLWDPANTYTEGALHDE